MGKVHSLPENSLTSYLTVCRERVSLLFKRKAAQKSSKREFKLKLGVIFD